MSRRIVVDTATEYYACSVRAMEWSSGARPEPVVTLEELVVEDMAVTVEKLSSGVVGEAAKGISP